MKITIKPYKTNVEPQNGDKAIFGDMIVEMRYQDKNSLGENCWIFESRYGGSSNNFKLFKRPFDENGNLLPIEMWQAVIDEMQNDRILFLHPKATQ